MTILLIGATGLLGHNVLLSLLSKGHDVVAIVRKRNHFRLPEQAVASERLTIIESPNLRCQIPSFDAIVNCAGTTDMSLLKIEDYLPGNVDLCRDLLQLMESRRKQVFVHVSTANTIGYGTVEKPGTEKDEARSPFADSFYCRSKRLGEQLLIDYAACHPDAHIVILNPGFMVGSYDVKPSSGKLLLAGYRHRLMAAPAGGKSFVHVADVADAVVNALTMGRNGERYLLTAEDMSIAAFYRLQAEVCGYRQAIVVLPRWITDVAGRVGDLLRALGIRTQLSLCNVRQLQATEYYSYQKAASELDFTPKAINQAIMDFFNWRRNQ